MLNPEEIKNTLRVCINAESCWDCPLDKECDGLNHLVNAFALIEQYEKRIEELEDELSDIEANDYC